ncbi:MAG: hypothetical protein ACAH88_14400 [Roseimicrobium sp.]
MFRTRRVILSFLALSLVLGASIATTLHRSVTATWQPQDPLRFSLVDSAGPPELISGLAGARRMESIVVENTSDVPIHLISMWVAETPGARVSLAVAPSPTRDSLGATSSTIVVPPQGTVYATSAVPLECITAQAREDIRMNFLWQTRTRNVTSRALEWLYDHSPPALQAHIPGLQASLHHAPLAWASHAQPAP